MEAELKAGYKFLILGLCFTLFYGCSGAGRSPVEPLQPMQREYDSSSGRHAWGYWDIAIDPDDLSYEVILRRDANFHLNARKFLEDDPCSYCLNILGIQPSDHGTLLVDVEIRHPFLAAPYFTGFDVRGIVIFPGSKEWPENEVFTSDSSLGDAELINPDGFTRLFNPTEFPPGSSPFTILEYSHGTKANSDPATTLNAFKNFYSYENRRYFANGDAEVATYDIYFPPGPILFGYAIDASWKPPTGPAPLDVPDDFPITANCIEPYLISATQVDDLEQDGTCLVEIEIYDWQRINEHLVFLETPELFDDDVEAEMVAWDDNWAKFEIILHEEKSAATGDYDCLVRVEDHEDGDPNLGYIDAFNMFTLKVVEGQQSTESDGNLFLIADGNTFTGSMGEDNTPLMTNFIQFDAGPGGFADADIVKFYNGHHGRFNTTLTAMQTLVNSLGYTFVESEENPIDTTGCRLIVIYEPGFYDVDLFTNSEVNDLLYLLHNGGRILFVSDYTNSYYPDKTTFNDLLSKMGCTVYDDEYTSIPGIYVTDLADSPVMEGLDGFSMAANSRFILGPEDVCLGYSETGGGVMLCSTMHYN